MCQINTDTIVFKSPSTTGALNIKPSASADTLGLKPAVHTQSITQKQSINTSLLTWCSYILIAAISLVDPVSTKNLVTCITVSQSQFLYYPQSWFASYAPSAWM